MNLGVAPGARAPDRAVWINGSLVRGEQAVLSVFDRGARDGGAIFETLRVYGGVPFAWDRHMERLVLSAAELGFPVPPAPARMRQAVDQLLDAQSMPEAVVRLTVTRGIAGGRPTRTGAWIEAEPVSSRLWAGARTSAGTAMFSQLPFEPGWLGRHKTTSRLAWDLAREECRAAGADEAILVSPAGMVLEGAASNLFALRAGGLVTPPLSANVLPGITRALVMGCCAALGLAVREAALPLADLRTADEVFLTNSVQEILPLATLAGRALPSRTTGLRVLATYRELVAAAH